MDPSRYNFETLRPIMPSIHSSRTHIQKGTYTTTNENITTAAKPGTDLLHSCSSARRHSSMVRPRLSVVQTTVSENLPYGKVQLPVPRSSVLGDATNTYSAPHRTLGSAESSGVSKPPTTDHAVPAESHLSLVSQSDVEATTPHKGDPQQCGEYMHDIFKLLKRDEPLSMASPTHMAKQIHINTKMRAILIDWLVDVHKKYKMRPETLFLAVQLLDQYLDKEVIARRQLQLVGITSLMISAKFEEIYPPKIKEFVHVCDKAYSQEDINKMEILILQAMNFQVCCPTAMHFLDQYQRANACIDSHKDLCQYLLELALVDYKMLKYPPSHQAAAAILLSNKLLRKPSWSAAVTAVTKMTEPMLKECAREMCALLENAEANLLQAVRRKFSHSRYNSVAQSNFMALPAKA